MKGLPSNLAGYDRFCTQGHVFELLPEAPLLFSDASLAPFEVFPGAFGICDEITQVPLNFALNCHLELRMGIILLSC